MSNLWWLVNNNGLISTVSLYHKAPLLEVFWSLNPVCLSAFNHGYKSFVKQSSWRSILLYVHDHIRRSKTVAMFTEFLASRVPSSGNLENLPTNFRINSSLDMWAIKECNSTGVKWRNCDKRSVQSLYCFQCHAFSFDDCVTTHNTELELILKEHRELAFKDKTSRKC